jgi:hypothetical protein
MTPSTLALILVSVTIFAVAQLVLRDRMTSRVVQEALLAETMHGVAAVAATPVVWLGLLLHGMGTVLSPEGTGPARSLPGQPVRGHRVRGHHSPGHPPAR